MMDSGNSSSMKSSSGGDDQEYDSRSFFQPHTNIPPLPSSSHLLPLQSQLLQQPQPSDHPNFLQPDLFNWAPASLLRSDPNTNYLSFTGGDFAGTSTAPLPSTSTIPSASSPAPPLKPAGQQPPRTPGPSKNPKKRTRASRRAPTTVLTTDTTNFRAMVQEFTGIPDPPFSSSSASSRRLCLITTAGSSMRLAATLGAPPFRPAAQRLPSASLLGGVMDQDTLAGVGSGQPDPTSLAFERLIQQPLLFPPPSNINSSAFGISMGGMDPPEVGVGFGSSSSQPGNNNYVMSCGALTSSSSTDFAPPQGNADYRNQ